MFSTTSPQPHARMAHVEPKGNHQSERTTMGGKSLIANKLPRTVGKDAHRDEYLEHSLPAAEPNVGFIEQTMAQTGTYQYAKEAI